MTAAARVRTAPIGRATPPVASLLRAGADPERLGNVDLVIEAVTEDLSVTQDAFAMLDQCTDDTGSIVNALVFPQPEPRRPPA